MADVFLGDLRKFRSVLMGSDKFLEKYDDLQDAANHTFLFRIDSEILEDEKPIVGLFHGSSWRRDIQSHHGGENLFRTTSQIVVHFEKKISSDTPLETVTTMTSEIEDFCDWVSEIFWEIENQSDYLILSYSPESTDTPAISAIENIKGDYISYRIVVNGNEYC